MSAPYSAAGTMGQCPTCGMVGTVPLPVWNSPASGASAPSEEFPSFDEARPASAKAKSRGLTGCGCLFAGLVISFAAFFCYSVFSDPKWGVPEAPSTINAPSKRTKSPAISSTGECVVRRGTLASPSEELLDKALRYVIEDDEAALIKLMKTGQVIELRVGMRAHLVKSTFTGKIKIRPHGQTIELWTVMEAIEEKD